MKSGPVVFLLAMIGLLPVRAGAQSPAGQPPGRSSVPAGLTNPTTLRASELLAPRESGATTRVLFEWDPVPQAREYVLQGRWVDPGTWALFTREFRVTAQNANRWTPERVLFEVSLPPGSHSWTVVAVFDSHGIGDFARPTHVSFDLGGIQ